MKERDKIGSKYREYVARLIEDRPETGSRCSLLPEEMDDIWEEISSELDIGDVWLQISSGLDKTLPPHHGPGPFQKYCAAVILVLSVLIYVEKTVPEPEAYSQVTSSELTVKEQLNNSVLINDADETKGINDYQPFDYPSAPAYITKSSGQGAGSENIKKISVRSVLEMNSPVEPQLTMVASFPEEGSLASASATYAQERTGNLPLYSPAGPEIPVIVYKAEKGNLNSGRIVTKENPQQIRGETERFSVGLITAYKNTWLLTRETFNGLRSESLNTTEFVLFPDAGISLGYVFTDKWSVQTEAFLYSSTGQEYHDYIFGHYARKKIVLRYSTIALRTKYKTPGKGFIPGRSSLSLTAGSYLSFLHDADQVINMEVSKIRSDYSRFDFGIMLGGEFELLLNEYLSLAPGLNVSIGLTNIYRGNGSTPDNIRMTHNGSAGFRLSFYYRFE